MFESHSPPEETTVEEGRGMTYVLVFQSRSSRMLFVRKVFGTVGFQLLVCAIFSALCLIIDPLNGFFHGMLGQIVAPVCMGLWMMLLFAISCCNIGHGKPNPFNISLLLISTALAAVGQAGLIVYYDVSAIAIAGATTLGVVTILALISFNAKVDLTGKWWLLVAGMLAFILFTLIVTICLVTGLIPPSRKTLFIISMVISGVAAVLYAVMILYELQLIIGDGECKYSEDDWLLASILLFYIIIKLFSSVLNLTNLRN